MCQPEGFQSSNPLQVCKLHKALYGLKQAPKAWFFELSHTLHQFGFNSTKCDTSLFSGFTAPSRTHILVYVDDHLITRDNLQEFSTLINNLNDIFALKDLGQMHYFLGIQANSVSSSEVLLTQTKYIKDFHLKTGLDNATPMPTPMVVAKNSQPLVILLLMIFLFTDPLLEAFNMPPLLTLALPLQ